jgi:hypothetical protein
MTEYELVETFYTLAGLLDQFVASFITLLFAFLVASYLVSAKLDRRMVIVVIALYSYMALRYVALYLNVADDMIALADQLTQLRLEEDSSLDWMVIGDGLAPMHYAQTAAMFLSFLASLLFFFHTRRAGAE